MGTISVSLPSDGTGADVGDYNTPITALVGEFNGNIDNANIKTGAAIATAKLADDAGITNLKVSTGFAIKNAYASTSALVSGTTILPYDDTIPQITEGNEMLTLSYTPISATNLLVIQLNALVATSVNNNDLTMALFQDATANALAAIGQFQALANAANNISLTFRMTAGTTSATTFRMRVGGAAAGTVAINSNASGTRRLGGVSNTTITITEYKA